MAAQLTTNSCKVPVSCLCGVDFAGLAATALLLVISIVFIYSSTSGIGLLNFGNPAYYFHKQISFVLGGIILAALAARYHLVLCAGVWPLCLLGGAWALLLLPLFFKIAPGGYQASAFAGPALILFLSASLAGKKENTGISAYLLPLLALGVTLLLLVLGGALGAACVVFITALFILVAGGVSKRFVVSVISAIVLCFISELVRYPYRWSRLLAFRDPLTSGYQTAMSEKFLFSGGLFGNVPAVDMSNLPGFYSDFGFSGFAANLGWAAALVAVVAVGVLVFRALRLAQSAGSPMEKLLASGTGFYIGLQAVLHLVKCFGFIPPNSIPFPLLSYGGGELLSVLFLLGILVGISKRRIDHVR